MYFLKSNLFIAITTTIFFVYVENLYAQNSAFVKPISLQNITKPSQFMASARANRDTSELFYYSFEEGRVVPYYHKYVTTEDSKTSNIYVCEGNNVVLTAPDYGLDAMYSWKGPQGFYSMSQQVTVEKINPFQAGYYTITIRKNGSTTVGKVKVMVKERPMAIASGGVYCFGEPIKLSAADAGLGAKYRWSRQYSNFTAQTQEALIENLEVGEHLYNLTVTKGGCKAIDTTRVTVKTVPYAIASNLIIKEGEIARLTAEDAGKGAAYSWKGPYLPSTSEQNPAIKGLPVGKYIYILTVVKDNCHSMNVAVVEVEKNEVNASTKTQRN
jgi:hypothetical protein